MLEDFSLVDKRQVLRNKLAWDSHFILTYRKNPHYICLNVDKLAEKDYLHYEKLTREIWVYLQG